MIQQPTTNSRACYLVTGAAGFIASKVCEMLLAAGHTVVGIDNLNDYYDVRLKDYRLSRLLGLENWKPGSDPRISGFRSQVSGVTHGNFTFQVLDIEDRPSLERLFTAHKFDAVFNLAARAGVRYSLEYPELYWRTNVMGEENVLNCQVKYGVKKHVLASSSSVYAGCPMPFVEDAPLGKMQSPYAETKRAAELLAKKYHDEHGLDVTVLRYFTVFGPAGRPDMAPFRFIKWIDEGTPITLYGDGSAARDFTYIDDIARGTVLAAKHLGFEVINLGGGNNPTAIRTVLQWIETMLNEMHAPGKAGTAAVIEYRPPSPADMHFTWADILKAERILGWKPQVSSEHGFRMAVKWHADNRSFVTFVRT